MEFKIFVIILIIIQLCNSNSFDNQVFRNFGKSLIFKVKTIIIVIFKVNYRNRRTRSNTYSKSPYKTAVESLQNYSTKDFVYNLAGMANPTKIANNTIRPSSVKQFPALENMGISCTLFELAPCGINLPHIHPRASELIYVISADNLQVGFVGKF
jgi:hypothetical protein